MIRRRAFADSASNNASEAEKPAAAQEEEEEEPIDEDSLPFDMAQIAQEAVAQVRLLCENS